MLSFSVGYSIIELRCDDGEEANPFEIAKRIFISNSYEQTPFLDLYKTFKFAFPDRQNDFLENINEFQFSLLNNALKNKQTFEIRHPFPFIFEDLFNENPLSYKRNYSHLAQVFRTN